MTTIITGTNRPGSEASQFAKIYAEAISGHSSDVLNIIDLADLSSGWFHNAMYEKNGMERTIAELQQKFLIPSEKFVFIIPEYNGSFPGVLKMFIDAVSVREFKATFAEKKAALVGVSTGRAGNLRGLEHFTGILNHLGMVVYPDRLPISSIEKLMDSEGNLTDDSTKKAIEKQIKGFIRF
jgi:chromate reductase, NAD(P)H dehydrogenase (quinone)